ncbi:hypothetical protein MTO96_013233 [Rhipicephalus appendiculatus]
MSIPELPRSQSFGNHNVRQRPSERSWPEFGNAGFSPSGEDVASSATCSVALHFVVTGRKPGGDPTSACTTGGEGNHVAAARASIPA